MRNTRQLSLKQPRCGGARDRATILTSAKLTATTVERVGEMSAVPFLTPIEARFHWPSARVWLQKYGTISIACSVMYVALVFLGRRWMAGRSAYHLRRPLVMWNTGLAVFSILGFVTVSPRLAENLAEGGFVSSVCQGWMYYSPDAAPSQLWTLFFLLSKSVELGDTAFIVLRKTPLSFLHWYHHVTVFIYCAWYSGTASVESAICFWFGTTNYFVHSLMYSYYTLKAAGVRVPRCVAQVITLLQLAQFVVGVTTILTALVHKASGIDCDAAYDFLYTGLLIYVSYFILFINFFIQRYLKKVT